MNGKSERPISFSESFCIWKRSIKLISFPFVWERETLAAVHSTHDYGFWSNIISFWLEMSGYFIKSKYKLISSLIRRKFQRFRNFSFENISLCLAKHIGRSLTEFATLNSFKLTLNLYIITLNCRGKAEFVRNHEWAKLSPFARANYGRTLRAHPMMNHRKFLRVGVLHIVW